MTAERFPEWEKLYQESKAESLSWFNPVLDSDLEAALKALHIERGRFLDLGTGPGTQAVELAKRGFEVTGTDLSATAIVQAAGRSQSVRLLQDDVLNSRLQESFDYAFDRGCFRLLRRLCFAF